MYNSGEQLTDYKMHVRRLRVIDCESNCCVCSVAGLWGPSPLDVYYMPHTLTHSTGR